MLVEVEARGIAANRGCRGRPRLGAGHPGGGIGRWSERSAAIATAVLIGDRSGLPDADTRRLQDAGTYHVIAISGGNIAILTLLLLGLFAVVGMPIPAAAALPSRPARLPRRGRVGPFGRASDQRGAAVSHGPPARSSWGGAQRARGCGRDRPGAHPGGPARRRLPALIRRDARHPGCRGGAFSSRARRTARRPRLARGRFVVPDDARRRGRAAPDLRACSLAGSRLRVWR